MIGVSYYTEGLEEEEPFMPIRGMGEPIFWSTEGATGRTAFLEQRPKTEKIGGGKKMGRSLYQVVAIDPKTAEVVCSELYVADDAAQAERKAIQSLARGSMSVPSFLKKDVTDYDFVTALIGRGGEIRAKKETQKVEMVESDEE